MQNGSELGGEQLPWYQVLPGSVEQMSLDTSGRRGVGDRDLGPSPSRSAVDNPATSTSGYPLAQRTEVPKLGASRKEVVADDVHTLVPLDHGPIVDG
jgi:hypothetical protein